MPLLTSLVMTSALMLHPAMRSQTRVTPRATIAVLSEAATADSVLLGKVQATPLNGVVAIRPEARELARVGTMLKFGAGGTGVIVAERCGLYFAAALDGNVPKTSEEVSLLPRNLTVVGWDGDVASWGGVHDFLGRPTKGGALADASASVGGGADDMPVFAQPVSAAQRRPIGASLHTGVVAIDALAPIGRGQSMMLFGPDALPAGSGRTDVALRLITAQTQLGSGVRCVLVLADQDAEARQRAIDALAAAGALENTKVIEAATPIEGYIAAQTACSIAQGCGADDVLVVVDSLRPYLLLWQAICKALKEADVVVTPEEEGSQQRGYYSRLSERAARRKQLKDADGAAIADSGGSVTLLLLQPSVSVLPSDGARKEAYTLADFQQSGFTQTVCDRIAMLEGKGVTLTEDVLVKVGIPLPGSDHPVAGRGQRSAQHLEELTSLVDGHIDLRQSLAAAGRVPPIDPSNSLTRIGVGSTKLRPLSSTPAMAAVSSALRLELAAASDPGNFEQAERARAAAYLAAMHQPEPQPLPLGEEVLLLLAAQLGLLDAPVSAAQAEAGSEWAAAARVTQHVVEYVRQHEAATLDRITESGLLSDTAKERLAKRVVEALEQ